MTRTPLHRRLYKPERNDYAEKLQAQVDEVLAHEPPVRHLRTVVEMSHEFEEDMAAVDRIVHDDPPKRPLTDFLGLNIDEVRYGALLIMMSDDDPLARYDLIPPEALHSLAVTYGIGAKKHGERNWQEVGIKATDNLASMRRHMDLLDRGVDIDPDDGQDTAAAIVFRAAAHIYYAKHRPDLDDRDTAGFSMAKDDNLEYLSAKWRLMTATPLQGRQVKVCKGGHEDIVVQGEILDAGHIQGAGSVHTWARLIEYGATEWRYV